jgi:PleD family two-component response regulator
MGPQADLTPHEGAQLSSARGVIRADMSSAPRILVGDDQPNIVDMLSTVLSFHGFLVRTAGTAAEALAGAPAYRRT